MSEERKHRVVHVLGNGDSVHCYKPAKGLKVVCNLPPFHVDNVWASVIVDFKMCAALTEGSVEIPYTWVCGMRPKIWMEKHPSFYMKKMKNIREFYTVLPKYIANYTDFNCGHVAVHYACNRLKGTEIHMYGFDSIFDFTTTSATDFVLNSDRGDNNTARLTSVWRNVWKGIFEEYKDTKFILYHHRHSNVKVDLPDNVEMRLAK